GRARACRPVRQLHIRRHEILAPQGETLMSANILTVDDSASIRLTTNVALSNAGYNVTEATNGAEGIAKATSGNFDLIVTDLNMPVMDGLTMIRELRKIPSQMGIPIIFLTTESDGAIKE